MNIEAMAWPEAHDRLLLRLQEYFKTHFFYIKLAKEVREFLIANTARAHVTHLFYRLPLVMSSAYVTNTAVTKT